MALYLLLPLFCVCPGSCEQICPVENSFNLPSQTFQSLQAHMQCLTLTFAGERSKQILKQLIGLAGAVKMLLLTPLKIKLKTENLKVLNIDFLCGEERDVLIISVSIGSFYIIFSGILLLGWLVLIYLSYSNHFVTWIGSF